MLALLWRQYSSGGEDYKKTLNKLSPEEANKYKVIIKHTPTEGLDYLGKTEVGCIILDIMLPEMDGFQVLRKIRENLSVPVIMLTARV